jgi:hypothetical protein
MNSIICETCFGYPCRCTSGVNVWPTHHYPSGIPLIKPPPVRAAWVCPVCKAGVAPHVERCPCVDLANGRADT